jgi:hypothetical protein
MPFIPAHGTGYTGVYWHDCIKIEALYANVMGCSGIYENAAECPARKGVDECSDSFLS